MLEGGDEASRRAVCAAFCARYKKRNRRLHAQRMPAKGQKRAPKVREDCEEHKEGYEILKRLRIPNTAEWTCANEKAAFLAAARAYHPDKLDPNVTEKEWAHRNARMSQIVAAHECLERQLACAGNAAERSPVNWRRLNIATRRLVKKGDPPGRLLAPKVLPTKKQPPARQCGHTVTARNGAPFADSCHFLRKGESPSPLCELNAGHTRCVQVKKTACVFGENRCRVARLDSEHDDLRCKRRATGKGRCSKAALTACRVVAGRCRVAASNDDHDARCQRRVSGEGRCRLAR